MSKYNTIFITFLATTVFYGLITYSMDIGRSKDIGSLRGSIIEARKLLDAPIKKLDEEASPF